MEFQIMIFGQLTDITGSEIIRLSGFSDTTGMVKSLNEKFPEMAETRYAIAIDKKIINKNTVINSDTKIVLMPPFSGG
jgi:sulfur-carrier protein